jgi:nucleotide-binding universal stress UspA family protein
MAEVKKIMVAVDDSEFSHYALQWALNNLHLFGSDVSLVLFHAQPVAVFNSAATMGVTCMFVSLELLLLFLSPRYIYLSNAV